MTLNDSYERILAESVVWPAMAATELALRTVPAAQQANRHAENMSDVGRGIRRINRSLPPPRTATKSS